jgi:hypothetical protein
MCRSCQSHSTKHSLLTHSQKLCCQPFPRVLTSLTRLIVGLDSARMKDMSDGNNLQQMEREFVASSEEPPQYCAVCRPVLSALNTPF